MTTAYSASALNDLKKQIAHKAIQWYLRQEPTEWSGDADSGFWGMSWDGRLPPVSGPTGTIELRYYSPGLGAASGMPPGAKAAGSGYDKAAIGYIKYTIDPWADIYEPWISRIDSAFEGWDTLPDPADFSGPIDHIRTAVQSLTPLPSNGTHDGDGDFGDKYTSVDLTSDLDTMSKVIGATIDRGALVYAFQNSYGDERIRGVMNNQAQVAIALGLGMIGEQKVMQGARSDIMNIASQAVDCFRPGGAGGDSINLDIVKSFADLIGDFVPPPFSQVISTGTKALSLIQEIMPKEPPGPKSVGIEGWTPDEVYNSLCDVIHKLNKHVFDHEWELAYTTLSGMTDDMRSHNPDDFDINPQSGLDPKLLNAPKLDVSIDALKEIGYFNVPRIAAVIVRAADDVQGAVGPGRWTRWGGIGLGSDGPYSNWSELQGLFDAVTVNSAKELVDAGQRLAQGAGFLHDTDGETQQALGKLQGDLGRGQDGWDNKPPPTGVYVGGRYISF